jgi:hypothetical protein
MKKQLMEWEKISANYLFDKELIPEYILKNKPKGQIIQFINGQLN